ncbi:hypothetical protein GJ744_008173 [Endocarpon pusillum]|uniref:Uncharacterized protein n=1 Tax=Endocarpon pusillum TaxID=364733 RepID=A0A8H7AJH0_9EURO|nr:hypothetical protein GJ744_008173 [Endocarpon pusillum]
MFQFTPLKGWQAQIPFFFADNATFDETTACHNDKLCAARWAKKGVWESGLLDT